MPGELALDGFALAHQNHFGGEVPDGQQSAFDDGLGGVVSAHRIDGDFRHRTWVAQSAFLSLNDGAAAIKAAVRASAVGQNGFAAIGAGAPLRLGQAVVSAALVLDSLRGSSLRYRHGFSPVFLRVAAAASRAV